MDNQTYNIIPSFVMCESHEMLPSFVRTLRQRTVHRHSDDVDHTQSTQFVAETDGQKTDRAFSTAQDAQSYFRLLVNSIRSYEHASVSVSSAVVVSEAWQSRVRVCDGTVTALSAGIIKCFGGGVNLLVPRCGNLVSRQRCSFIHRYQFMHLRIRVGAPLLLT